MKKVAIVLATTVAVLFAATTLVSCATTGSSSTAAAPAATAAPAAAVTVEKASAPMVVADFEDPAVKIGSFTGPKSTIKIEYQGEVIHGGKSALKVTKNTSDWSGALLEFKGEVSNWAAYSSLNLWVFGTKNGQYFNIDLEDKGSEQFRFSIANDFEGWKEFNIPFADIPVRSDWQADTAVRNKKIDWPLKTLQFFTASKFNGFLVFDDISVMP